MLELDNVGQALTRLDDDEKDTITTNDSVGRPHQNSIVSEPGVYRQADGEGYSYYAYPLPTKGVVIGDPPCRPITLLTPAR